MDRHVIDVAMGNAPADLVICNGKLVNVLTKEIYKTDVAISGKVIAAVGFLPEGVVGPETKMIDAAGRYLVPGFIDAHIHFESSMLTFTEFSRMVVKHGTTAVASDLMEIAIVSGREGIEAVFKESETLPVKLFYPVPSFMEEEGALQTIGAPLNPKMMEELIRKPQAIGLAEVLYPPIINKSPASERIVALAKKYGKTLEGHAPALFGAALNAYASVGIRSDHESTSAQEAIEKLRRGLRVLIREGCAAADLDAVIKIITESHVDSRHCALVSDDIDMLHIHRKGHLDYKVRRAVQAGLDPLEALQMVTINPAESLKIDDRCGSIAPGKCADIVLLSDLENCTVESVISDGSCVVEDKKVVCDFKQAAYPDSMRHTIKLSGKIKPTDLVIRADPSAVKAKVHVIGANATSLLTDALEAELLVKDGVIESDIPNDILHIACIERYGKGGGIGRSFIHGFGIKNGAIATSVGHDHHNITAVGTNPEDMAVAVNRLAELDGGIIIVENGRTKYELPLPICGLLSDQDGENCAGILESMQADLKEKGCTMQSPYMTLAFITLIFIPHYGITDKGLVDVLQFQVVDPIITQW